MRLPQVVKWQMPAGRFELPRLAAHGPKPCVTSIPPGRHFFYEFFEEKRKRGESNSQGFYTQRFSRPTPSPIGLPFLVFGFFFIPAKQERKMLGSNQRGYYTHGLANRCINHSANLPCPPELEGFEPSCLPTDSGRNRTAQQPSIPRIELGFSSTI